MLFGPSQRPRLPDPPAEAEGLPGVVRYLRGLDRALETYLTSVIVGTIGVVGLRGLSTSGTPAQNLVKSLAIGNQTSISWVFSNMELDASYMLLYSATTTTGVVLTSLVRTTTSADFTFNPAVPSGVRLDVVLLR